MIVINNIRKTYISSRRNKVKALDGVSFTANDGEITALLGPNGAGKTTLLRILAGLEYANGGEAIVNGVQHKAARKSLAYLSDGCGLYKRLTAYENIAYFGELYGLYHKHIAERIEFLTPHLDLSPLLARKVRGFSQGERMRIAIARALVHDPQTIVLDEPTNGLDLSSVRRLRRFLRFLATPEGGNKCILFSSHVMHEVMKLADQITIITAGNILTSGSLAAILQQADESDFEEAFVKLTSQEARS